MWLIIKRREKRITLWSEGRAEKMHVCLASSGINGQVKLVWHLHYQLHVCVKGDVEYDKYFMVLYEQGQKIIQDCVICVMSPSVQGQGGWEIVQNFLMVPS